MKREVSDAEERRGANDEKGRKEGAIVREGICVRVAGFSLSIAEDWITHSFLNPLGPVQCRPLRPKSEGKQRERGINSEGKQRERERGMNSEGKEGMECSGRQQNVL